ncbi:flavodoxin [Treponema denticola]|uniref:Flavodoxin n=1 Tax=Treponema denticola TaxID=158 RepID=A0A9Q9BHT5_TREDN|nr:flavodoxin family protein [Treponema denticola]UTC89470.1 flavodoxin [Treponema denticola]UTD01177.1 flavodoxin [Treponema denticola]
MSNVCIVYSSTHHGNTEKVLNKIKEKFPETVLIKAGDFNLDDFNRYEAIGFASGIFYFKFAKPVDKLFERALVSGVQKLFFIYTAGAVNAGFEKALRKKTEQSGKICMGIFGCKGFDTFGPLKLIGGLNKNSPNEKDFKNAIDFFEKNIINA